MDDDDVSKMIKSVEGMNVKIINLGKRIDRLEKVSEKVETALEKIPYAIADVIDRNLTNFTIDSMKEDLNELKLTTNDIQRETTFLSEAFTRSRLKRD